jgi:hypothetical protein
VLGGAASEQADALGGAEIVLEAEGGQAVGAPDGVRLRLPQGVGAQALGLGGGVGEERLLGQGGPGAGAPGGEPDQGERSEGRRARQPAAAPDREAGAVQAPSVRAGSAAGSRGTARRGRGA